MKTKVQLNDMELNQVTGGSLKSFWQGVKNFFHDLVTNPQIILPVPMPAPEPKPIPVIPPTPIARR